MVQIIDLQLSKILDPADIFGNNESNIGRCMKSGKMMKDKGWGEVGMFEVELLTTQVLEL
jgi:hypothetical protein